MNMRKIIAVLAAMMLLCTAIPMGALSVAAAPGDVILDLNFNDGTNGGFDRSVNENGYLVFDSSTGNWQNTYKGGVNGFQKNVDYLVTFKAKADRNTNMNFKINSDWSYDSAAFTVDVTTEWQEYESIINMSELGWAIVMFSSNTMAADGATYYIDDLKIVEKKVELEVGKIINGDFENGSEGWTLNASASIENGALKLDNSGQWSEAAMAEIAVEVGTEYTLSWKSQRVSGNGAYLMFVLKGDNSNHPINGTNWMNNTSAEWIEQEISFVAEDATLKLKISPEVSEAGVILIDDITLTEVKQPSFDGFVTNGDFEIGDGTAWTLYSGSNVSADAAYTGSYGLICTNPNGGWGGTAFQDFNVTVGKSYKVTMWAKTLDGARGQNIQVQNGGATVASKWFDNTTAWTLLTFEFTATAENARINICGGGTGANEMAYIDDIKVVELVDPSNDGFIKNGNFESGEATPWTLYSGTAVSAEAAYTGNFGLYIKNPTGGWGGTAFQDFSVEVGKSYEVTMWAKNLNGARGQNIQIQNGGATVASKWFDNTNEWTLLTFEFTATAENCRINICGGGTNANEEMYVDDIKVKELKQPSFDGYIYNGDFETGELHPWDNLWGSCPTVEIVEGGKDSAYALNIVSGKWLHVRQTNIAVEANTIYKISLWAKNTTNMCMLVKDGADAVDLCNKAIEGGEEWTYNEYYVNTGDYTSIIVSLMGGEIEDVAQEGTFDNIKIEKHEHEYVGVVTEEPTCELTGTLTYTCECGATNGTEEIPAYHNGGLEYHAAVEAIDCANPGNIEYWFCPGCYEYFANAEATEMINPWFIEITVDCVRPEGIADCATVTCETCGNEIYGYGEHDVLTCQGGTCSKCGENIEGVGCQNFDTPACEDGVCYYCGGFVAGFGHENGAWAPCLDGECAYGCGLTYPATEDHIDADADDYCDNCWNHLACVDADADGWCDICWSEMPAADIIYGDADGDGEITVTDEALVSQYLAGWDVELDVTAADADGDGEITVTDEALISQFLAGWEVVLGPQG